jgi:hypothetical protein
MKRLLPIFILIFAIQISAQQRATDSKKGASLPVAAKSVTSKITQFLEKEPGVRKLSENIWAISYQGKSFTDFDVLITPTPSTKFVIMLVVIAKKKDLPLSQDLLYKILKYNSSGGQAQAGIDDEGDLYIRAELTSRLMDSQEFKSVMEETAGAADELHGLIKNSLITKP